MRIILPSGEREIDDRDVLHVYREHDGSLMATLCMAKGEEITGRRTSRRSRHSPRSSMTSRSLPWPHNKGPFAL